MRFRHVRPRVALILAVAVAAAAACGDDGGNGAPDAGVPEPDGGSTVGLEDFLPEPPAPTGEPQAVWAGEITQDQSEELIDGPATSGLVGDYFLRNARSRYVVQAPTRAIGVVPQGGNLVDAVLVDEEGNDVTADHFGELSFVYLLGRTCAHREVEIVQDGSEGGAAVLRARGVTEPNDFINLRGIGLPFSIPGDLIPDTPDGVECATTYVLEPDSTRLEVRWTLFNPNDTAIDGPFGTMNDSGGDTEAFSPTRGFERLGFDALTSASDPAPVEYVLYQGPGVSYGVLPVHDDASTPNAHFLVAGVSVLLFGGDKLLDILERDTFYLDLPAQGGLTHGVDIALGRDAADVEAAFAARAGDPTAPVSGEVTWSGGDPASARVGLYEDTDDSGDLGPDDAIRTYADTGDGGAFSADVAPGTYLVRAAVKDEAVSDVKVITVKESGTTVSFELPTPALYDFTITDQSGDIIPAKITVIGEHPAFPDYRLFETYDRVFGVVRMEQAIRGTSVTGSDPDERLSLPAGSTYRILVTRGTEWSFDSAVVSPVAGQAPEELQFELSRVASADGYVSSEYHVHSVGSPDSPVLEPERVATAVADGVELFASSDHAYVADLQPEIEALGLAQYVRNIVGLEITTFPYGHFNAFPLDRDPASPNGGAVDWARGMNGYAMLPGDIFDAARDRGAELVQVNHPRATAGGAFNFGQYFDRAGLTYDYDARAIVGDYLKSPVPNEWLRLPAETSLWDDGFNALEVWNGFDVADTNEDGVREIVKLDVVMADWFNFLSFGLDIAPIGNSDTHTVVSSPMGMPRTYVRVTDDSAAAIEDGRVVEDLIDTLAGRQGTPQDIVVTNGPHVEVSVAGEEGSAIGQRIAAPGGSVTLQISATAPSWAQLDTLQVFANATPATGLNAEVLQPLACFTTRESLGENDPCAAAPIGGGGALDAGEVDLGNGVTRYELDAEVTIDAADVVTREGATGEDAWFVVRVRGSQGIFPVRVNGVLQPGNLDTFVSGTDEEQEAVLENRGVPAAAFTAPINVDFDDGGYLAPFAPQ